MQDLIVALGLFLVLEGLIYALFPNGVKRMAETLPTIADQTLRNFGLGAVALGVAIVWLVRG